MASQSDWEKEYEAERKALEAGGGAGGRRRINANDEALFAEYYGSSSSTGADANNNKKPDPFGGISTSTTTEQKKEPAGSTTNSFYSEADLPKGRREAALDNLFGGGGGGGRASGSNATKLYPEDDDHADCRFDNLPYEPLPQTITSNPIFQDRISPYNFFAQSCDFYTRAIFGQNKITSYCFVSSHGIHFLDATDASMIVGMPLRQLGTVYVLGPQGIGLRSNHKDAAVRYDIFVKFLLKDRREAFVGVVKRLYKKLMCDQYGEGGDLFVVEGSDDKEKSYRKEITWLKKGEFKFSIEDDPRSGLDLVSVPLEHRQAYAAVVPKILHHFGGVNQICFMGKIQGPHRRGCWLTPGAIFLSLPAGPGDYGDGIRRCIYAENIHSIVLGDPNQLGVVVASGSPQPDLLLEFDSPQIRSRVVFCLRRMFKCRTHHPLFVRSLKPTESVASCVKLGDESKFQPRFDPMFTIPQLVGHLTTPVAVAKK